MFLLQRKNIFYYFLHFLVTIIVDHLYSFPIQFDPERLLKIHFKWRNQLYLKTFFPFFHSFTPLYDYVWFQ